MASRSKQRKDRRKQLLFDEFAENAALSGFRSKKAYYCPLCLAEYQTIDGLTLDHVPLQAAELPTVSVLTCKPCNNGSGPAQDQLLQRHRWLTLKNSRNACPPKPCRVTLAGATINATMSRDANGEVVLRTHPKRNNPRDFGAFRLAYHQATGSDQIHIEPLLRLNEPQLRWAVLREAYLLLFHFCGYWLLSKPWTADVRDALANREGSIPSGAYVAAPVLPYSVAPTKGEVILATTPENASCLLVPVIDASCAVLPMDDPAQTAWELWTGIENAFSDTNVPLAFTGCKKLVIAPDVKSGALWKVQEMQDPARIASYWIEIARG